MEDYICEDGSYKDERKKGRRRKSKQKLWLKKSFDMTSICVKKLAKERDKWAFQPYIHPQLLLRFTNAMKNM
jgi:hypothetical protein